ncbi:hypothetical protein HEP84_06140 [Streptomyces sp. RLB1-33]|uniref:hypothetical protein n=1 Tax=Streptomyces mirabilis TaxID=68239 RepID=UPI00143ED6AD|nr:MULTISPECIES: hypothetical protein [Streptomyces]QIY68851.1 hypothetical protein HEP84_06140 [Streptomyces sp. RLB1-33]QUW84367.1 hypothetical protein SMIR_38870 [Streptomyces mirabilis]
MRIRSILSLAVPAVAVMALATPAQAADDGFYYIRDVRTGACLAEGPHGGRLAPCDWNPVWEIRNQGDGMAQIVEARGRDRCLALAPIPIYPPLVSVDQCGSRPDRWTIQGQPDEGPVAIAFERGELGRLTTEGDHVTVTPYGGPQWILERLG